MAGGVAGPFVVVGHVTSNRTGRIAMQCDCISSLSIVGYGGSPTIKQLDAAKKFLTCAVELGELDKSYMLFGARQVSATASPGNKLFDELKTWDHFTDSP
nr:unnamed protein product [Callosobruchus analis]